MPALLTSTSIGPTSSSIRATAAPTAARSVTSNAAACAFAPDAASSATTFSTLAASRPLTTTVAPAPARPRASARPMPADEPVTSATICESPNRRSISFVTDVSSRFRSAAREGGAAAIIVASRREGEGDYFVGGVGSPSVSPAIEFSCLRFGSDHPQQCLWTQHRPCSHHLWTLQVRIRENGERKRALSLGRRGGGEIWMWSALRTHGLGRRRRSQRLAEP